MKTNNQNQAITSIKTTIDNQAIKAFIESKTAPVVLLDNSVINTNSVEDSRLEALRDKGIVSLKGCGNVTIVYADGHKEVMNAALGIAGLLAGVTITNLKDSFLQGKFASRGRQIVFPADQIEVINTARIEQHNAKIEQDVTNFADYINGIGAGEKPVELLETLFILWQNHIITAYDNGQLWIAHPTEKLSIEGLISLEVVKERTSWAHRVQHEETEVQSTK